MQRSESSRERPSEAIAVTLDRGRWLRPGWPWWRLERGYSSKQNLLVAWAWCLKERRELRMYS